MNFRYLRYLGRMYVLNTLNLDYPALSNQVLHALGSGASKTLKNLNISIRDSDVRQHTVGDEAWSNLVVDCPELKVSYTIGIHGIIYLINQSSTFIYFSISH